jgi:two-component system, NarL family, nitrate/nitrite response regulator NarL
MRLHTVVLIDEHDLTRAALRQALVATGMHVVGEGRGPGEVLEVLRDQEPSAVVIDPVFAGVVHLDWVERLARLAPATQVVVLTSSSHRGLMSDAIASGARGFLLKSSRREAIATGVRACATGESVIAPELLEGLTGSGSRNGERERERDELDADTIAATLTKRELEIFRRLPTGESNREIGTAFQLSENTVKNHVASILTKLKLDNRIQAAVHAVRNGLGCVGALVALEFVSGEMETFSSLTSFFG